MGGSFSNRVEVGGRGPFLTQELLFSRKRSSSSLVREVVRSGLTADSKVARPPNVYVTVSLVM